MLHHFMHYLHIKIPGWCNHSGYAINSDTKSGKVPLEPQAAALSWAQDNGGVRFFPMENGHRSHPVARGQQRGATS